MMPRIAHIRDEQIVNVSIGPETWTVPEDGSQMLETDAVAAGIPYWTPPPVFEDATKHQISVWLARHHGLLWDDLDELLLQLPHTAERTEARARLRSSWIIPFDNPLVEQIAAGVLSEGQTLADVWPEILSIERGD
jgi:hypothetical protein